MNIYGVWLNEGKKESIYNYKSNIFYKLMKSFKNIIEVSLNSKSFESLNELLPDFLYELTLKHSKMEINIERVNSSLVIDKRIASFVRKMGALTFVVNDLKICTESDILFNKEALLNQLNPNIFNFTDLKIELKLLWSKIEKLKMLNNLEIQINIDNDINISELFEELFEKYWDLWSNLTLLKFSIAKLGLSTFEHLIIISRKLLKINKNLNIELFSECTLQNAEFWLELQEAFIITKKKENSRMSWIEANKIIMCFNNYKELPLEKVGFAYVEFELISISLKIKWESKMENIKENSNYIDFFARKNSYMHINWSISEVQMKISPWSIIKYFKSKLSNAKIKVILNDSEIQSDWVSTWIENLFSSKAKLEFVWNTNKISSAFLKYISQANHNPIDKTNLLREYVNYFLKLDRVTRIETSRFTKVDCCIGLKSLKDIVSKSDGN